MLEEILSENAKKSLGLLGKIKTLKNAYLAGGTAAALQLGHRQSKDFDFFIREKFSAKSLIKELHGLFPNFQLEKIAWGTVIGYIGKTRFSIFFYEYPLLFESKRFLGIQIADLRDVAAMKIAAISDRGTKRDFVDLYFFIKNKIVTLEECLDLYDRKFRSLQQNKIHIIKSLSYFAEADIEEMPRMFRPISWKEIKTFLERETRHLSRYFLLDSRK